MANLVMNNLESLIKKSKDIDEAYNTIESYMVELGGVHLGGGVYSNVYEGKDGGGYVVKTAFNDNHLDKFLKHAEGFGNPLVPKVVAQRKVTYGDEFGEDIVAIYIMEKLEVDNYRNKKFFMDLISVDPNLHVGLKDANLGKLVGLIAQDKIDIEIGKKIDVVLREKGGVSYDDIHDYGHILYDIAGNFNNDIHARNYGFDPQGNLIIFDPLSHSKPTYAFR